MIDRVSYESGPPRRRLHPAKVVTPAVILLVSAAAIGEWACAPRVRTADPDARTGSSFVSAAQAAMVPAAPPQQPAVQPAAATVATQQPTTLAQLDEQLVARMRQQITEEVSAEMQGRVERASAEAFPVRQRMEMSSTMYCLKGSMRTGVRTRDGMAAGDPSVLPLGSVVRVSRPSGELIGIFVIMDTGGAIRGNKIDLYVDSCREAERWGRHPVVAEVLDIGKRI
ncbi:3D domain-containing protein [Longimicrobium sp.]|uniref:3D domain-containing protein n=1 Tax=Longimicrobium sp. TaxID=2029185 RepID=UPI002B61D506|nr:3D domain-containing protein [Longimicrobium sp.]HSU14860.1 3D domain-containing protein [Longimicrobium sp.]